MARRHKLSRDDACFAFVGGKLVVIACGLLATVSLFLPLITLCKERTYDCVYVAPIGSSNFRADTVLGVYALPPILYMLFTFVVCRRRACFNGANDTKAQIALSTLICLGDFIALLLSSPLLARRSAERGTRVENSVGFYFVAISAIVVVGHGIVAFFFHLDRRRRKKEKYYYARVDATDAAAPSTFQHAFDEV
mmetsp:Transcript_45540/g.117698  ORF Transcript_45540/g.117698 Transcript_45540/m.117698 type:complete len:194 (-) Transcript_45540:98-679(-)